MYCFFQFDKSYISWEHIVQLYRRNKGRMHGGGLYLVKLKKEHVVLNSYSKMRVDLAAQVHMFSTCTCNLEYNVC